MKDIASIRKEYSNRVFDQHMVDKDPVSQFIKWFNEAVEANVPEPNAMSLASITADGRPSSRMVLLKGVEHNKFVFYTNVQSRKGLEIQTNPAVALNFFWAELERQVRIEGLAERVSPERVEAYFHSRPRESQIGAWTSPQSSIIESRAILEERFMLLNEKYKNEAKIPMPKQWGGYQINPVMIEFWQGRESRLHDRINYTMVDEKWQIHRLAP
jgi:pyridoxamine 5'-phosphate oxidase